MSGNRLQYCLAGGKCLIIKELCENELFKVTITFMIAKKIYPIYTPGSTPFACIITVGYIVITHVQVMHVSISIKNCGFKNNVKQITGSSGLSQLAFDT